MQNLALIILDSLGYQQFQQSNHPNIDEITEISLKNAYSNASWTIPSTASILTGLESNEHHAHTKSFYFCPPENYLPLIIKKNCYAYVGVPYLRQKYGFDMGFNVYEYHNKTPERFIAQIPDLKEPYFLFLNFHDTHYPFGSKWKKDLVQIHRYNMGEDIVTKKHLKELKRQQRKACERVDNALKTLFYKLEDCKIIITSDHGDLYGEEHTIGHSLLLHHNSLHVPLITNFYIETEPEQLFPLKDLYHIMLDNVPPLRKKITALNYSAPPIYPRRYWKMQVFEKTEKEENIWTEGEPEPEHLKKLISQMRTEPITRIPEVVERLAGRI